MVDEELIYRCMNGGMSTGRPSTPSTSRNNVHVGTTGSCKHLKIRKVKPQSFG